MTPAEPKFHRPAPGATGLPVDFDALARSESSRYFAYARRTLNREDAEDTVAEAFMEIYKRWRRVLESRNARAFAFKIFKDVLHSRQRFLFRQPVVNPLEDPDSGGEDDGYGAVEARIALGMAMAELERTSPRQAECVRMHYFAHASFEEIAAALDITVAAAKASTSLGKRRLCRGDDHDAPPPPAGPGGTG